MPKIEDSILIEQPVEIIFDYITTLETLGERIPSVVKVAMVSGEDMRVGARYQVTSKARRRKSEILFEVIEYELNRAYATKIVSGSQPFKEHYQLAKRKNGTMVTLSADGDTPGLLKPFRRSFERLLIKQVRNDLERLKNLLEEGG